MNSDSGSIIIIVVCIIMSAFFSATETAFSSLNRIRVKNMAEKGNKRAELVLRLSQSYDKLLSTILIGNNIVNIASASLATVLFVKLLGAEAGPSVSTAVTTIVVLIFGEISPKSLAKESPERFAMAAAPILRVFMVVLTPFNFLFSQWKKLLSRLFRTSADSSMTEEELLTIVEEAEQEGGIDAQEGDLIRNAIEFSEIEVVDILTPRIDMTAVPLDASKEEIAAVFASTEFSRLPVYTKSIDHIIGIINQKDFHNHVYHTEQDVPSIVQPALYVTKGKRIGDLLKELQKKKSHVAIVLDEFGGTIGMVTMEDIMEELVGEIWDEHDEVVEEIVKISDHEYSVLGSANVQKLFELLDIREDDKEDSDAVTVGGWVMDQIDRVPQKGDRFAYQNLQVKVVEMDGNRVEKVQIRLTDIQESREPTGQAG